MNHLTLARELVHWSRGMRYLTDLERIIAEARQYLEEEDRRARGPECTCGCGARGGDW